MLNSASERRQRIEQHRSVGLLLRAHQAKSIVSRFLGIKMPKLSLTCRTCSRFLRQRSRAGLKNLSRHYWAEIPRAGSRSHAVSTPCGFRGLTCKRPTSRPIEMKAEGRGARLTILQIYNYESLALTHPGTF